MTGTLLNRQETYDLLYSEYVTNAFNNCAPEKKKLLEAQLKSIITQAERTNMTDLIDWNERDLPRYFLYFFFLVLANQPVVLVKTQTTPMHPLCSTKSKLYITKHQNTIVPTHCFRPKSIISKLGNIELTPTEEKKRQMRAMRFQNDTPVNRSPPPTPVVKKKNKYTPITWESEAAAVRNAVIVGTSIALEKPYFRLTSVSIFSCHGMTFG